MNPDPGFKYEVPVLMREVSRFVLFPSSPFQRVRPKSSIEHARRERTVFVHKPLFLSEKEEEYERSPPTMSRRSVSNWMPIYLAVLSSPIYFILFVSLCVCVICSNAYITIGRQIKSENVSLGQFQHEAPLFYTGRIFPSTYKK